MAQINVRIDDELKKKGEKLFRSMGMNLSTAFSVFLSQSIRENGFPFRITLNDTPENNGSMQESNAGLKDDLASYLGQIYDEPPAKSLEETFLNAINDALQNGYYIYNKDLKGQNLDKSKLLGKFDGYYYYILGKRAYDLYAEKHPTPAPMLGVYASLLNSGYIKLNESNTKKEGRATWKININGITSLCLKFYANKVKFGG